MKKAFASYLKFMTFYVIIFSSLDMLTNVNYKRAFQNSNIEKKTKILSLLIFHNVLYVAIYFTLPFILYYRKTVSKEYLNAYLVLLILIPIHWYRNNNQCWFTLKQNELLGINKKTGFRDFVAILRNKDTKTGDMNETMLRDKMYEGYLFIAIAITVILIGFKEKMFMKTFKR